MFAKSILAAAFLAGAAAAQSTTTSAGTTSIVTSSIAAEVSAALKASWCNSQQNVCKLLCNSSFNTNTCDPTTLTYTCTCSNGTSPGLQYYENTIDFYTCEQAYTDCINNHPNDQAGQDGCTNNIRNTCGTLDVASYTAAAATTSSTAASTAASSTSGSGTASGTASSSTATSTTKSGAVPRMELGAGIFGAGLFAAFGFLL